MFTLIFIELHRAWENGKRRKIIWSGCLRQVRSTEVRTFKLEWSWFFFDSIYHHASSKRLKSIFIQAGVVIRVETVSFRVFPYENIAAFEVAVRRLNPVVAVKIRNATVQGFKQPLFSKCTLCFYSGANTFHVDIGLRMTIRPQCPYPDSYLKYRRINLNVVVLL